MTDKVAIVTGVASGIGRGTCKTPTREGARVMIADIDDDDANKSANTIGDGVIPSRLDVSKEEHWQQAVANCLNQFERLDIVVDCTGIGTSGDFEETDLLE